MERIPAAARAYLSTPGLSALWHKIRERLERNGLAVKGSVVVELDYQAAEDLSGLLGRSVQPGRVSVRLVELDAVLRASVVAHGLVTVIAELTGGRLTDRKAEGRARQAAKLDLWARWEEALAESGLDASPWVHEWQNGVRRAGLLSRASGEAETVIQQTAAVLRTMAAAMPLTSQQSAAMPEALPIAPTFELAELASRACADAHALDDGKITAALVLRAIAAATGEAVPSTAAGRRELWAMVGVVPDTVSGTVLTWAVRPPGDHPWAVMMRTRADLGLVTHVTLQEWHASADRSWASPGDVVFVCENPQVLQAAARARATRPLLCTSGNPAAVALLAVDRLIAAGVEVRYHGDFDTSGVRIAARLFDRGARPWRFGADDYTLSLQGSGLSLTGAVPETPWSPGLEAAMRSHQVAVHEEALLDVLLADLSR